MLTDHYRVTGADFSGDGSVTALITRADCALAGSSCFVGQPKYQSEISGFFGQQTVTLRGQIRLSRNGRYAVLCCDGALASPTVLRDLNTGATRDIPLTVAARPSVSSTGLAVVPDSAGSLRVAGFDGSSQTNCSTSAPSGSG